MKYLALQTVAMLAMQANAKTISVSVGKDGLEFSPANIKADKGDILEFKFYPIGHSVAIGDAKNACSPLTGAKWYSGIQLVNEGETPKEFRVTVENTDTMYLYCSVMEHCQSGMVAVVNGKSDKDLADYKQAASKAKSNVSPADAAFGGSGGVNTTSSATTPSTPSSTSTPSGGPVKTGAPGTSNAVSISAQIVAVGGVAAAIAAFMF